ncbi:phage integrase family protein [Candidatus Bathyarchaeota archaeon A05DMB-2]|jgi:integrase|nr:phage integrase family protein [Candidatus Bathyarchaeota archaeon A05DMB-2]
MTETILKTRGWYWQEHGDEYVRFKVGDLPEFCGWKTLLRLVDECGDTEYYKENVFLRGKFAKLPRWKVEELRLKLILRDKGLVATAFETGGRISEVLGLRKSMFTVKEDRIIIRDMPVVKRFKKEREVVAKWEGEGDPDPSLKYHFLPQFGGWVKRKYVTKPVLDRRNVLEIPIDEPLTIHMVNWMRRMDDWLFPSYAKNGNKPMSTVRAYQIVRDLGERIGLHICPHWFRSMRASQLASEYGWREWELMRFFSWKSDAMAQRYAKLSPTKLFETMKVPSV